MYELTLTSTRPTTDVEFFSANDGQHEAFRNNWGTKYLLTGKVMLAEIDLSSDKLTQTITHAWDSEESFNESIADPVVIDFATKREEYNNTHGITSSRTGKTI
jgi:hypothetical protein